MFFEHFQSSTRQKNKTTFYIISDFKKKEPNIKSLYSDIINKCFDKRNLATFQFPEEDFSKITNYISEKISYYNGYEDLYDKNDLTMEYLFNILICGISDVGKSTLVNMFQQSNGFKEGEGNSVTDKIIRFTDAKYPIGIYDTPGLMKILLLKLKNYLKNTKKFLKMKGKK